MARTGATGAARTQHTQSTDTKESHKTHENKDTKALKTLLGLIFTVALAGNHSATANTAAQYATLAGQTMLLMKAADKKNPYIDPHLRSTHEGISGFAEELAQGLTDLLSEEQEKQKAPEPISLRERSQKLEEQRQEIDSKNQDLVREFEEFADDLGMKTQSHSKLEKKQAKKQARKTRSREFDSTLAKLRQERSRLSNSLIKALTDSKHTEAEQIKKEISRHDIKQRVFDSIPQDQRSKKGVLEETKCLASEIDKQLVFIDEAKQPIIQSKRSLFGLRRKTIEIERPESRQRAIETADQNIKRLRESSFDLNSDNQLTEMIDGYKAEA